MAKYYAWTRIRYGAERDANDPKVITKRLVIDVGEEVDAKKLKLTDEQFEQLVEAGSVRAMKYPDVPKTWTGSPVDWYREQAKLAAEAVDGASMGMLATLAPPDEDATPDEDADKS